MRNRSLRTQLGIIFWGFLLLVVSSVGVTFWLVQTQQNDAAIINLAGRQRMLAQQMTRLALTDPANPELGETIARFDQTLRALLDGGEVVDRYGQPEAASGRTLLLPMTTDPAIRRPLQDVAAFWPLFQTELTPPVNSRLLESETAVLLARLDAVVSAYEAQARAKIAWLRGVQAAFLTTAFLLLAWGYCLVRRQLLQPLAALGQAAQDIGAGKREEPLPALPANELGQLAETMETMRSEITAYQTSLEQQVGQRTQELTTAFEFSQEIVHQLDADVLLPSVAQRARDLLLGQAVSVCVLAGDGHTLELVAGSGAGKEYLGLQQSTRRGIALPVIQQHQTVITEGGCAKCSFLHHFPGTSCMAAPLQVGERTLGALCVVRPQQPFDANESRALTLLANAAAVALENARLIAAGKKQAEENASLSERQRLAAELHDHLAQTLGAINLQVGMAAELIHRGESDTAVTRLKEMQTNLQSAYTQVRMALTGLRDPLPEIGDLRPEVQSLLADFEAQSGLPVELIIKGEEEVALTAVSQKQALHILREALTNIRRHAQASRVQITIARENGSVIFHIQDDGKGFDPSQVHSSNHLGLTIMQTRAERSRGQLTIHSMPGQGTQVTAVFPAKPAKNHQLEGR
ncbi:MAG: GAF domain-containing protein [Chloroflexi bacterium]|nr:type IV pili methyl-accepting chemotaxis transducer N-terminal domain-containing protein [Ardenticatenaceae bacterium]MBL1127849.1 GAF domain-containing protein [Chloroflexota bacterium]NOG33918.1 GAF domain-containing protein [Chloroflexota bacterium]GIK55602.1 MAG: nitrate/nitrite sensor protein [Chloroflexota bacterium]